LSLQAEELPVIFSQLWQLLYIGAKPTQMITLSFSELQAD
jgi:hypothetical protein